MEGTIAEIRLFSGNFAPRNWAFCDGQLLTIATNPELYSLLGTTYGGDGRTTFALPDLRSRAAIGSGYGIGLPEYSEGQQTGAPTTTLTIATMPPHNHLINASNADSAGTENSPQNAFMGTGPVYGSVSMPIAVNTRYATTADTTMDANAVGSAGHGQPFNNIQPSLAMRYIICVSGIFPSRS